MIQKNLLKRVSIIKISLVNDDLEQIRYFSIIIRILKTHDGNERDKIPVCLFWNSNAY